MKNIDLENSLKSVRVPERSDEYWETFPPGVLRKLRDASRKQQTARRWRPQVAWGIGLATVCVAIVIAVKPWQVRAPAVDAHSLSQDESVGRARLSSARRVADPNELLQNEKVWREVLALFPNRVRAIVQDEHGLQLVLSDLPDVPVSPPLWVKVCAGKDCRAAVTFSGQEVEMDGIKITVLSDARGNVILTGEHFVWTSDHADAGGHPWRIEAKTLL